jgi:DNA-binding NarL/FixJ family response regulator
MKGPCRILLVDADPVTRRHLRRLIELESGWTVCAAEPGPGDAARAAGPSGADAAVVDGGPLGGDGPAAVERLRRACPGLPLVVVSMEDEVVYGRRMCEAGADAYVTKAEAAGRIVEAIRGVLKRKK